MYRSNATPIKIPAGLVFFVCLFLVEINKLILKFTWKGKGSRIAQTIMKRKNEVGRRTLPDFKFYCKATVIEAARSWLRGRYQ